MFGMKNTISDINPWYVTGLVDGEGCFSLALNTENRKRKKGTISSYTYWVTIFRVSLREDDYKIIDKLRAYFNCGSSNTYRSSSHKLKAVPGITAFHVKSRKDLISKIIPHFDKYPLQAKKRATYKIWREAVIILFNADKKRPNVFSRQILTMEEESRLRSIKQAIAEPQTGGHRRIAMKALEKKSGKIVREQK